MPALYFLLSLLIAVSASGATAPKKGAFDSVAVHDVYLEGEFSQALKMLEPALNRKDLKHGDSVFIFKHLGVIFAASETTREKGKYYMYKLVEADPRSNILDMYASDNIYMIFKNVKDEYEAAQARKQHYATAPSPSTAPPGKASRSHQAYYWLGGVGVATAVGVSMLVYLHSEEKPLTKKTIYGLD